MQEKYGREKQLFLNKQLDKKLLEIFIIIIILDEKVSEYFVFLQFKFINLSVNKITLNNSYYEGYELLWVNFDDSENYT